MGGRRCPLQLVTEIQLSALSHITFTTIPGFGLWPLGATITLRSGKLEEAFVPDIHISGPFPVPKLI